MGRKDIPLNDIGIDEAYTTSEVLKDNIFDLIICSPLMRAKQTANIINENRNNEIIYDERIMERCLGDLEGKPYTSDNNDIWDININSSSDSIETMVEFKNRVYAFLDEVLNKYPEKNILLVTHGGVSALINCYFNNNIYEGSISDKFLKNCDYASYDTTKNKVLVRN